MCIYSYTLVPSMHVCREIATAFDVTNKVCNKFRSALFIRNIDVQFWALSRQKKKKFNDILCDHRVLYYQIIFLSS